MKVIELGSFIFSDDTKGISMFKNIIEMSESLTDNEIDGIRNRMLNELENSKVRSMICEDRIFRDRYFFGNLTTLSNLQSAGLYLFDIIDCEIPRDILDHLTFTNTTTHLKPLTMENITNGNIKIPSDVEYIICSNMYILGELLTTKDEDLPEIFKSATIIVPTLQRFYIGNSSWASYSSATDKARLDLKDGQSWKRMRSQCIKNILRLVSKKNTVINSFTKNILISSYNPEAREEIFKSLTIEDRVKIGSEYINASNSNNLGYVLDGLYSENIETIIDNTLKKANTVSNISKLIKVISEENLNKKSIRNKFIEFYKHTKSKSLPGISKFLEYLDKEDIEVIGYLNIKNYLVKCKSHSSLLEKLDSIMNGTLNEEEKVKLKQMNYYKGTSMSKTTFPAFITYLNMVDSEFLDKHKQELVSTLIDSLIKLGYYAFTEPGVLLDNKDNIEVIGPEFCEQLNSKRITVVANIIKRVNGSTWQKSIEGEKANYKRLLAYIDTDKHTKLAEAYAVNILD